MGSVNIFESIAKVTSRYEPFHSQFFGDVLSDSLKGDRCLFEEFWRLAAPDGWGVPLAADVKTEMDLGIGYGRIDICISDSFSHPSRILGIEVKTTDSSTTEGQLDRYRKGLREFFCKKDPEIALAYLTPFNRQHAGEFAPSLPTVAEFDNYSKRHADARHVSWLDIADIAWDYGNQLWQQHRIFVRSTISSFEKLKERSERDRSFNEFFGDAAADAFWNRMKELGFESSPGKGADVALSDLTDIHAFVRAFEILINEGEGVPKGLHNTRPDQFSVRAPYLSSGFRAVHKALFDLSKHKAVWIQGKKNYGVRVAHSSHASGVSLVRSLDSGHLRVGEPR